MGRTVRPDLGQVKNCLRTRPNKHYYPPQCTDSMADLVLLCLAGGCGSEDVRGYWFDYWDYSQSCRLAMKKLTTTSGIVQTALFPDTVKSYSQLRREELFW
jgi:hypothetical protein